MSGKKDPSIKLFGKTIKIGSNFDGDSTAVSAGSVEVDSRSTDSDHNMLCSKQSNNTSFEQAIVGHETDTEQNEEPSSSSGLEVSKIRADKASFNNEKETSSKDETNKEDQCDQTSGSSTLSQDQCHPKKPDKIIPCPRCKSMDTKFCYFNNYNVNQPRHFCKNCQRYWTAGGTMRNLAVGAGRRKSKSSSSTSQCRNHDIVIIPNNASSPCGYSMNGKQDSNDKSICCNVGAKTNGESRVNTTSLPPPLVCFTGNSWPYTWSPIPIQSGCHMSFYSPTPPPPPFSPCIPQGTLNSPSLGKHPRDGNEVKTRKDKNSESYSRVVMPKRIRIDDPIEAANSSILATLGVNKNNDKLGLLNVVGGRFFGGFEQAKYDNNNQLQDNQISTEGLSRSCLALQANPAAFSWSLSFHENAY